MSAKENPVHKPHSASVRVFLALTVLLAVAPTLAWAQSGGDTLVDEGRFADAVAAYQRVIDANPNDARAHHRLARAAVYQADRLPSDQKEAKEALFDRAAKAAQRAVELAPSNPDAHFEVARALGRLAQFRGVLQSLGLAGQVRAALDKAIELNPNHGASWHALALFHRDVPFLAGGRSNQVVPSFERAIAAEPNVISHRVELARVLANTGKVEEARAQLQVAVGLPANTYLEREDLAAARTLANEIR
jgi:tetratricopeptide (TPR) repeat protein